MAEDFRFAEAYILLGDLAFREEDFKLAQVWYMMAAETKFPTDAKLFVAEALYQEYPMPRIKDCHNKIVGSNSPSSMSQIEAPSDVKEVLGVFSLPPEEHEALLAGSVLAVIAAQKGKLFGLLTEDRPEVKALVEVAEGLVETKTNSAISLILPPSLNGRSREEWYARAAGHVLSDWSVVFSEAQKVAEEARRAMNANSSSV